MKSIMSSVVATSLLLAPGHTLARGFQSQSLALRDLRDGPRFEDLVAIMDSNNSISWMDDGTGTGGRLARIDDDTWAEAHELATRKLTARSDVALAFDTIAELMHVRKRQGGHAQVVDDNGKSHEADWICRSGLGQNLVKSTPASVVCAGMVSAFASANSGTWIWSGPPAPVDGDQTNYRSVLAKLTKATAGVVITNACANIVTFVVGENCPATSRRSLDARQSDGAGGSVIIEDLPVGGQEIALFEIGVGAGS